MEKVVILKIKAQINKLQDRLLKVIFYLKISIMKIRVEEYILMNDENGKSVRGFYLNAP